MPVLAVGVVQHVVKVVIGNQIFLCCSELMEPLGPVEPPEPVLPSQTLEIEIETPEVRKK